jgi:hypothetical protein
MRSRAHWCSSVGLPWSDTAGHRDQSLDAPGQVEVAAGNSWGVAPVSTTSRLRLATTLVLVRCRSFHSNGLSLLSLPSPLCEGPPTGNG